MARTPKEVTDAELAVLEVLWQRDAASVRQITDVLYPGGGNSETATVQKLCERLLSKKYVGRNRRLRPTTFHAAVDRRGLISRHLKSVADKLCSGSFTPLLTNLVEAADLNAADIEELRRYVEQLDAERRVDR